MNQTLHTSSPSQQLSNIMCDEVSSKTTPENGQIGDAIKVLFEDGEATSKVPKLRTGKTEV